MCGICGILNIENDQEITDDLVISMRDTMIFRGPDDAGFYLTPDKKLGFGHRRLSIMDLSFNARQPMTNEDGSIFLVFNGEIYNFLDLKEDLIKKGHVFKSKTDSEVIIHLYEEIGKKCVNFLRGMFAFAIWDNKQKVLLLARDPLGKKPLVYSHSNGRLYFASEIKALLTHPDIDQDIDLDAIMQYFSYIFIPYPRTIFKSIKKIPPASIMIIQNGKITLERYKYFNFGTKIKMDEKDYHKTFLDLLDESVKIRLHSDVPFGVLLSSGIDSSSIVAITKKFKQNNLHTYSIGYQTVKKQDAELDCAKLLADRFKTCHEEIIASPDILSLLPEVVQSFDEPNSSIAIIIFFFFLSEIKKDVTVVLWGGGGDEVFGGYSGYNRIKRVDLLWRISRVFPWKLLEKLCDKIMGNKINQNTFQKNVCNTIKLLNLPMRDIRAEISTILTQDLFLNLFDENFLKKMNHVDMGKIYSDMYDESKSKNLVDFILYSDLLFSNQHGIIVMPDVCGMANSLEIRSPYLDEKMVDFAASLPVNQKVKSFFRSKYNKYIVKESLLGILPKKIIYRKKMGFGYSIPINDWCKNEWKDYISNMILRGSLSKTGIFNMHYIHKKWEEHISGKKNHLQLIWSLLIFEVWYRLYIEKIDPNLIRYKS